MSVVALVAPTASIARSRRPGASSRLRGARVVPFSLAGFLADADAPRRIVVCPEGSSLTRDLAFLRRLKERALWPAPPGELAGAIAGLRGSHGPAPGRPTRASGRARESALLLESDVSLARARLAAASDAPRDWVVERPQSVRIGAAGLGELARLGVRWSVLEPIEVVALAASPSLARARRRWSRFLPSDVAVWTIPSSK